MQRRKLESKITADIFVSHEISQNLKAWEPWEFTRGILFELQNSDIDNKNWEWRAFWISGVATLRTIGHVLKNVDSKVSPYHKNIIDGLWTEWTNEKDENAIFFEFIQQERNLILKEFSFGAQIPSGESDQRILSYHDTDFDAAQLFREAVYWWRYQLREIEKSIYLQED